MKRLPDESDLICAGQRGNVQAVEILFRRYHDSLYRTALRILGNTHDAEDALQDGLLSAYRNIDRFESRSQFSDAHRHQCCAHEVPEHQSSLLRVARRNRPRWGAVAL